MRKSLSAKICLCGEGAVGKSSLLQRYVYDIFDEKYIITTGTKQFKKDITVEFEELDLQVDIGMLVWDIMGQQQFSGLIKDTFFADAMGVFYVFDITRKETFSEIPFWIETAKEIAGNVPMLLIANKNDISDEAEMTHKEIKDFALKHNMAVFFTSAKTGENVNQVFENMGKAVALDLTSARIKRHLQEKDP